MGSPATLLVAKSTRPACSSHDRSRDLGRHEGAESAECVERTAAAFQHRPLGLDLGPDDGQPLRRTHGVTGHLDGTGREVVVAFAQVERVGLLPAADRDVDDDGCSHVIKGNVVFGVVVHGSLGAGADRTGR